MRGGGAAARGEGKAVTVDARAGTQRFCHETKELRLFGEKKKAPSFHTSRYIERTVFKAQRQNKGLGLNHECPQSDFLK